MRFRRTIATNAAIEGKDVRTIAAILDHSDTQTANVYMSAVPEIVDRINKAMAMDLAPLAQAFKGRLIAIEREATRGGDPSSRIVDLRIDRSGAALGSCGQHSFCGFNAPVIDCDQGTKHRLDTTHQVVEGLGRIPFHMP